LNYLDFCFFSPSIVFSRIKFSVVYFNFSLPAKHEVENKYIIIVYCSEDVLLNGQKQIHHSLSIVVKLFFEMAFCFAKIWLLVYKMA